ncbi:hypothetical protein [Leucobacter sp. cx-169]|uniref:hypothetical protein n=1 Tax=Leucobacter sp. cx-169 TaxID=2770549 RepID=UPI00165E8315|nr:hypothetical protein [Leucobacter sp. cx-169]MBC9927248.1 hypothetical protein [Leucobacter sp. cx-169]
MTDMMPFREPHRADLHPSDARSSREGLHDSVADLSREEQWLVRAMKVLMDDRVAAGEVEVDVHPLIDPSRVRREGEHDGVAGDSSLYVAMAAVENSLDDRRELGFRYRSH